MSGIEKGKGSGDGGEGKPRWDGVLKQVRPAVSRLAARYRLGPHAVDDVLQQALWKLLRAKQRGHVVRRSRAWLIKTARHVLADWATREHSEVGPTHHAQASAQEMGLDQLEGVEMSPEDVAILRDLWEQAPTLIKLLPPPYRQIAEVKYLSTTVPTNREVIAWLRSWLPREIETCRELLRVTNHMLRAVGRGEDLRTTFPAKFSEKNPWCSTPPSPFFESLGVEAARFLPVVGGKGEGCLRVQTPPESWRKEMR